MGKNDVVQTESSNDGLRRELDGKIDGKVPNWMLGIVVTIIIGVIGISFTILYNDISALNEKVGQLSTAIAVTNQKLEDDRLKDSAQSQLSTHPITH